ncbi:YaeQ family protein [uncultured Halopseudomonas sp.]|uniref:YaeQ family protein n=1 Tax=uncultured Halopseudomonas sp. TaxID=2901193 RepID=UPI0030EB6797|tara:strand:- start:2495 stop:3034 length:540 start_codon:yes stop_codon:yes gene_type:complete
MAQQATPYKVHLNLTDTDRGIYESMRMKVARHPSETAQRMIARVLAYGIWYQERLAFGRGLSEVDEPALWHKSLDDRIEHWIEVGQPDAERLIWCSRRAEKVSLLVYGNARAWSAKVLPAVAGLKNLHIVALPQEPLDQLADSLARTVDWGLMITDGVLYVSDATVQVELPLEWLMAEQ